MQADHRCEERKARLGVGREQLDVPEVSDIAESREWDGDRRGRHLNRPSAAFTEVKPRRR